MTTESTIVEETPSAESTCPASNPWKCWATIGLSLVIGSAAVSVQALFAAAWVVALMIGNGAPIATEQLTGDGNFLLYSTLVSYPAVIGMMILFIKIRPGNSLREYLDIRKPSVKSLLAWGAWLCGLLILSAVLDPFIQEAPADFMTAMLLTAPRWLVVGLLVFAAPIVEELFFRGFMFKGIAASTIGGTGAVVLTTLAWVAIHGFQYGWVALLYLALLGTILGMARLKTRSVMVPTVLHIVNNLLAVSAFMAEYA